MVTAARPLIAAVDDARSAPRWREPLALIQAQAKLLLEQPLSPSQRRTVIEIVRCAEGLARDLVPLEPSPDGATATAEADRVADAASRAGSTEPREPAAGDHARATDAQVPEMATPKVVSNGRLLLADDDPEMLELLSEILAGRYELTLARDGAEAVAALAKQNFNLAIVDLNLPVLDGFGVAEAMRVSDHPPPPFIFLSAQTSPQVKVRGLELGASDYVTKPFDPDELTARIARIIAAVERESTLRADAMTDSMTGLSNYRSFSESLAREVERSRRYAQPLSLVSVDLDHLKAINDEHGHDVGSEAIVLLATVLKKAVRSFEMVARIGGDEFALLLPNTDAREALALAERLREQLLEHPLRGSILTASIGVASRDAHINLDGPGLVKASDEALYRAKRAGRNRAELAQQQS
jgi:two-component system cell cycle response regulator